MVAHRRVAGLAIDHGLDRAARLDRGARWLDLERLVVADPVDVDDLRLPAVPAQHAGVGDLAAALGVEGALLELDQGAAVVAPATAASAGRRAQRLVADEPVGGRRRRRRRAPLVAVLGAVRGGGAGAGPLALLLHQLLEAAVVDREALLGEQLLGQVVGEAVGVVELEGVRGVDPGGLRLLAPRRPAARAARCRAPACGRSSPPRRRPSARSSRARRPAPGRPRPSSRSCARRSGPARAPRGRACGPAGSRGA